MQFLESAQPNVSANFSEAQKISFLYKKDQIESLLKIFEEDSVLDDFEEIFDTSNHSSHEIPTHRIKKTLEEMRQTHPIYHDLINLVINVIFSAPSKLAGGGSTSAAIGCIWVNLRLHWQEIDIFEFLVHETTHNLVFLDELCYQHYTDYTLLGDKNNFSWSAILNKLRPLDKVFHSIIVSTEVLLFRNQHLGHPIKPCLHPPSEIMLQQTIQAISYLKERPDLRSLLSERAKFLLQLCEEKLNTIQTQKSLHALSA